MNSPPLLLRGAGCECKSTRSPIVVVVLAYPEPIAGIAAQDAQHALDQIDALKRDRRRRS